MPRDAVGFIAAEEKAHMAAWDWSHGSVLAGANVSVRVDGAPCENVTVTLTIDGDEVASGQVPSPPGSVALPVPDDARGKHYVITVSCNAQSDSQNGLVG